jgi:hypothetical protein
MKELILVRGTPGAGKSTYANACVDLDIDNGIFAEAWEADMWMVDERGNYRFDGTRLAEVHQKCQQMVCLRMISFQFEENARIYVANTFVRVWEAEMYRTLAKLWGYDVKVVRLWGNYANVHGVPQDRVNVMCSNMEPYEGEINK